MILLVDLLVLFALPVGYSLYLRFMTTDSHRTSVRSREFGAQLRLLRKELGITGQALAEDLHWVGSTITRLEQGQNAAGATGLNTLLTVCGLRGNRLKEYLARATAEDNGYYLAPHGDLISDDLLALMIHEEVATRIVGFDQTFIPGLLQTEAYSRTLFAKAGLSKEAIERAVRKRALRQKLLNREDPAPPRCVFFLHENVLRSPVGGNSVMAEQMITLLMACGEERITIRVLPISEHESSPSCALRLMEFAKFSPIGYAEVLGASAFLEQPSDIERYRARLSLLDHAALDEDDSRSLLTNLERLYGQP